MEFVNYDGKIPATEWFRAILPLMNEGYQLKICPAGRSMVPFLTGGRDEAVLSVPDKNRLFRKNDIVLFKDCGGMHVLHRVCRVDKDGIYTLGDGNTGTEGPLQREDILAVTDYIIRKGSIIRNDDRKYLFLVGLWRMIRPFRPLVIKGYSSMRRLERELGKK